MNEKFRTQYSAFAYSGMNLHTENCNTGIKISGHRGTWHIIDSIYSETYQKILILLEHETYGDEAASLITDLDGNIILDDVWNGFDDLDEYLDYLEQL